MRIKSVLAGGLVVALATASGASAAITTSGNQYFTQAGAVPGAAESGDFWGKVVATGDFNNDGYADIATGNPDENLGSIVKAGAVTILYGSANGPTAGNSVGFTQAGAIAGGPETEDLFGASLAAGDFNGDGFDDLAVGAPLEDIGSIKDAGIVHVIFGSATGLVTAGNYYVSQDGPIAGNAENRDYFGYAIAAGDFNNDGVDDLGVGAPGEASQVIDGDGFVNVIYGEQGVGLTAAGNEALSNPWQTPAGVIGGKFGCPLVSGDFDNDGIDDLAVASPEEPSADGSIERVGGVTVFFGNTGSGINYADRQSKRGALVPKLSYGLGMAAGDFNGTGGDELLVGATILGAGDTVYLLDAPDNRGALVETPIGPSDHGLGAGQVGFSLAAGDFDGDGYDDAVIGDYGENAQTGAAAIIYGSATGLASNSPQVISQAGPVIGAAEAGDQFAFSLATGDLDNDGKDDLIVGAPGEGLGSIGNSGLIHVLYGS